MSKLNLFGKKLETCQRINILKINQDLDIKKIDYKNTKIENIRVIKGDTMIEGFVLTLALMTFCIGSSFAIVKFASKGRFF